MSRCLENDRYATIVADLQRTFEILESLPCDIFLAPHASMFGGLRKKSFIDPLGCRAHVAASKRDFEARLAAQRAAAGKSSGR